MLDGKMFGLDFESKLSTLIKQKCRLNAGLFALRRERDLYKPLQSFIINTFKSL